MKEDVSAAPTPAAVPAAAPLSYEAFLAWLDEDTWAEWVDGEVILMSPASRYHQDLSAFLTALLRLYVEAHDLGTVIPAPFQMKTGQGLPGREPDLLFVARAHEARLRETYLDGPADLAVEIVSPESRGRDRGDKFYEYEQGGVQEYWLVDPLRARAEFYRLGEEGLYVSLEPEEGVLESRVVPGFRLPVAWLWAAPLPPLLDAARHMGLLS